MRLALPFRSLLLVLLCCSGLMMAYADDSVSGVATPTEGTSDYQCSQNFMEEGQGIITNYENFLNEYFQVDTPSSGQFEDALTEYRYTKLALEASYTANVNAALGDAQKTLETANNEVQYCQYVRDSYLAYIKPLFQRQMMGSTVSKVTFKIVDGLKAMNKDMDSFAGTFAETFPTLFSKMNNALPCYARNCTSK